MDLSTTPTLTGIVIVLALVHLYSLRRISALDDDIRTIKAALNGATVVATAPPTPAPDDSAIVTTGSILRSSLRFGIVPDLPAVPPAAAHTTQAENLQSVFLPPAGRCRRGSPAI